MSLDRKKLKYEAHKNLKATYAKSILLMFIFSLIMNGGYSFGTGFDSRNDVQSSNNTFSAISKIIKEESIKNNVDIDDSSEYRGVLAPLINKITADKSAIVSFINSFKLLYYSHDIKAGMLSLFAATVMFLIYIFIKLVLDIGKIRYFLESRRYRDTKIDRLLFPYRTKRVVHLSLIIFLKNLYQTLWDLTIIGGFIKNYEYMMIPYILAENPSINRKEAFRLSKEMMRGYKWEAFKLDLSLIGWFILSILTFGMSDIFYTDCYRQYIFAEMYMSIRGNKESFSLGNLLCDDYLDVEVSLGEYPQDKYVSFWIRKDFKNDYNKSYSVTHYILFFFTFSFIGWIWEVILNLIMNGSFANRGVMFGPWLPIYGFGAIFILIFLKPFRKKPFYYFIISCILAGILEYSTALYLETFKHMKWWDYSGYFLNIHGRICLEGLIVFGFGGAAVTYFIAPILSYHFSKINPLITRLICFILVLLFGIDMIYSTWHPNTGEGVTSYKDMVELQKVSYFDER